MFCFPGPREYSYREIVDVSTSNCIGTVDLQGDGLYEYNMFMQWILQTDVHKLIMMNILYVDIENTKGCTSDFLVVGLMNLYA